MNNVSSRLLYIFLLLLTTLQMHAQICPNAELQRQMQIEERSFLLTSSLKKHAFYNLLINNILYLCVT